MVTPKIQKGFTPKMVKEIYEGKAVIGITEKNIKKGKWNKLVYIKRKE